MFSCYLVWNCRRPSVCLSVSLDPVFKTFCKLIPTHNIQVNHVLFVLLNCISVSMETGASVCLYYFQHLSGLTLTPRAYTVHGSKDNNHMSSPGLQTLSILVQDYKCSNDDRRCRVEASAADFQLLLIGEFA